MQPWAQLVLVACAVAVSGAVVAAFLALRRTLRRTDAVLEIVEQELRPLIGQANGLTEEMRDLTRETRREVERVGEVTEQVQTVAEGLGRVVMGLAGLTRAGQVIGLAAGLRRGVDVFVQRLRRGQGDDDGK
jgi:uncharacterized protein YoxC